MSAKKVFKNISWLVFDKVFTLSLGLIVLVKVANHYGASVYGLYQYALSMSLLLGAIALFVDERVVKKLFFDKDEGQIIFNVTVARVVLSFISLIIGVVIILNMTEGAIFNLIYILLLINNIVINLSFGILSYFDYRLKSKNVVVASSIAGTISAALQLISITLDFSIVSIVVIILASSGFKFLVLLYQFKKEFDFKILRNLEKPLIFSILRESTPLAIAAFSAIIYTRIDQVMIGSMLGFKEVGVYSISAQMISVVAIVIAPLQVSIYPKMIGWYNTNIEEYYKKYQAISALTTWIYICGAVFSLIVAPILFDKIFDKEYSESLLVFQVHIVGAFFMYNALLRSSHYTLTKNTNVLMISQIVAVFINILLNYLMIPEIGVYGAALATVITQFFSLLLSNMFFPSGREIFLIQLKGINPLNIRGLFPK